MIVPEAPVIVPVSIAAIERRPIDHNRRRRSEVTRSADAHTNRKVLCLGSRCGCQRCTSQRYNSQCLHCVGLHRCKLRGYICQLHNVASCLAFLPAAHIDKRSFQQGVSRNYFAAVGCVTEAVCTLRFGTRVSTHRKLPATFGSPAS